MLLKIPFSPRFMYEASFIHAPVFGFRAVHSHDSDSMDALFSTSKAKKDIPRTHFRFQSKKEAVQGDFDDVKEASEIGESPTNLKEEEVKAMFAFSMSLGGEFSQGGIFRGQRAFWNNWFVQLGVSPMAIDKDNKHLSPKTIAEDDNLTRGIDNIPLIVRSDVDSSKLNIESTNELLLATVDTKEGSKEMWCPPENPLFTFDYHYQVKNKDGVFFAEIDKSNYEFQIDENLWKNVMLPKATERLSEVENLTKQDIVDLLPFLIDPEFTKLFAEKLSQSSPEIINYTNYLIAINFGKYDENVKRISAELDKYDSTYYLKTVTTLMDNCDQYENYLQNKVVNNLKLLRDFLNDQEVSKDNQGLVDELNKILVDESKRGEISDYFRDHPEYLEALKILVQDDRDANQNYQSVLNSVNKLNKIDEIKHASFDGEITDNKEIIDNFAEMYYQSENNVFKKDIGLNEMNFINGINQQLIMISPPKADNSQQKINLVRDQQKEILSQIKAVIDHVKSLPEAQKSSRFRELIFQMEKRLQLLKDVGQSQKLKEELHKFNQSLENLPEALKAKFDELPKMAGIDWIEAESALEQFEKLCSKGVENLSAQKDFSVSAINTEAMVFNIEKERKADETDVDVIKRVTKDFLNVPGIQSEGELQAGEALGTLTEKIDSGNFRVCKIESDKGVMGFVEVKQGNTATSTVYSIPEEYLPEKIWATGFNDFISKLNASGYSSNQTQNITPDHFDQLFKTVKNNLRPWNDDKLQENLHNFLEEMGITHKSKDIAKFLSEQYKKERNRVIYDQRTTFPQDDIIQLAISQVDGVLQIKPDGPIVIRHAFNEANVKAVMLQARAQGLKEDQIINASNFKNVKMPSDSEVKNYTKYVNSRSSFGFQSFNKTAQTAEKMMTELRK